MDSAVNWGILAPGKIARIWAADVQKLENANLAACASRSLDRAKAFAEEMTVARAYGSYDELVQDENIQVVYVASPHTLHMEHAMLCMEAGKAVLCEKPLAVNAGQVKEMIACAKTNNVFLMEAMWSRFLPVWDQVRKWIAAGKIGQVRQLHADFSFRTGWDPRGRLLNPDLAGGALLDVGVYTIALASNIFGQPPASLAAQSNIGESGVDEQTAMVFKYSGGQLAQLTCAVRTGGTMTAEIIGTEGSITVPSLWWKATEATCNCPDGNTETFTNDAPGYQYQAAHVMECLKEGKTESPVMPLDESLAVMETMDEVRKQVKLKYPFE